MPTFSLLFHPHPAFLLASARGDFRCHYTPYGNDTSSNTPQGIQDSTHDFTPPFASPPSLPFQLEHPHSQAHLSHSHGLNPALHPEVIFDATTPHMATRAPIHPKGSRNRPMTSPHHLISPQAKSTIAPCHSRGAPESSSHMTVTPINSHVENS